MRGTVFFRFLAVFMVISIMLAACGNTTQGISQTPVVQAKPHISSSGFHCPEPSPRMEVTSKELNIYIWTEYVPMEVLDCFEMVYDIKLNRAEYSTNEEVYTRLLEGNTGYDLIQPSDYVVGSMVDHGLLQELDKTKLPNIGNLDEAWMDKDFDPGNRYTIPYLAGTDAIVVNTKSVRNPPQAWADLWKPEYSDRMIFVDDPRVIIGMTLLTLGYDLNTTDEAQLEEARVKLSELIPNVKAFDSDSPSTALIAGDVDLGIIWTGEAFRANRANPDVRYIYPREGALLWQDNWALLKDAAHPDAAYALLNYVLQGDVFWLTLDKFPYTNPNQAALEFARLNHPEVYEAYIDSPITNPPAEALARGHSIMNVGEAIAIYDALWARVRGE